MEAWDDDDFDDDFEDTGDDELEGVQELTDADVLIEDELEEDEWFSELMAEEPEEEEYITRMKSDPTTSSWVPARRSAPSNVSSNAKYAYNYLNNMGLPAHVSAGIVGNLMKESGVNPLTGDGDQRGGIGGIAQWDPSRSNNLRSFSKGRNPQGLDTQLDFLVHEATQRGDLQKTMNAKTPEEAAMIFGRSYERPNERYADWESRQEYARQLHQKQYGGINNIPLLQPRNQFDVEPNPLAEKFNNLKYNVNDSTNYKYTEEQGPNSFVDGVERVTNTIHKGLDIYGQYKDRIANIGAAAAETTSQAIDINNQIAGTQRDMLTKRKFNAQKNNKQYTMSRQSNNDPVIYI